nr:hypothetical protein [Nocardia macrotermitis]
MFVQEPFGGVLFLDYASDVGADFEDELRAEPDGGVVGLHGVLDEGDVHVWRVAGAVLFVAAEEVGVLGASAVDGVLEDHALGDAASFAALAEQGSLQVVVVHSSAFLGCGA